MNNELQSAFYERVDLAKSYYLQGELNKSFAALEEAHILGQSYIKEHTLVHFWMLKIGIKRGDLQEIFGQLLRIPMGIVGSLTGYIPKGNTGGANISMSKTLPIPSHLQKFLDLDKKSH